MINLFVYLENWKQFLKFGLLYDIKVIENTGTTKNSVIFRRKFLFVIIVRLNSPRWTVFSPCLVRVFFLTFANIWNSLFCNSKQHFKFFKSSNVCFPNIYVYEHLSKRSVKWRKTINEIGGNFLGGNFRGDFPWGSLIDENFPGGIFLELLLSSIFTIFKKSC